MSVKFGVNQLNSPAPRAYRNFRRAWNVLIAPALGTFISGWGFQDIILNRILLAIGFVTALINGVDMLLGSEDVLVHEDVLKQISNDN